MKMHLSRLPLATLLSLAKMAGQRAAIDAMKAGRPVAGWKDGRLIEYTSKNSFVQCDAKASPTDEMAARESKTDVGGENGH